MGRLTPTINIRPLFTSDFAAGGYYTFDEWAEMLERMLVEGGETDPEGRVADGRPLFEPRPEVHDYNEKFKIISL